MIRTELSWLTRENTLGPVLLDGGTGSLLLGRAGEDVRFSPLFNLSQPEMVVAVHREFIAAGSMIITANSFCAATPYLTQCGSQSKVVEVNAIAVQLARHAIELAGGPHVMVAGSIAPLPRGRTKDEEKRLFEEQMSVLVAGGVEILLCETFLDAMQGLRAVEVARQVSQRNGKQLPVILSMVPPEDGKIPEAWGAIAEAISDGRISLFGLNCGAGFDKLNLCLEQIEGSQLGPYWLKPSAGLPSTLDGKFDYPIGPTQFAEEMAAIVKRFPVAAAGGCCGTGPEHIHCLSRVLAKGPSESACTNGSVPSS